MAVSRKTKLLNRGDGGTPIIKGVGDSRRVRKSGIFGNIGIT